MLSALASAAAVMADPVLSLTLILNLSIKEITSVITTITLKPMLDPNRSIHLEDNTEAITESHMAASMGLHMEDIEEHLMGATMEGSMEGLTKEILVLIMKGYMVLIKEVMVIIKIKITINGIMVIIKGNMVIIKEDISDMAVYPSLIQMPEQNLM